MTTPAGSGHLYIVCPMAGAVSRAAIRDQRRWSWQSILGGYVTKIFHSTEELQPKVQGRLGFDNTKSQNLEPFQHADCSLIYRVVSSPRNGAVSSLSNHAF